MLDALLLVDLDDFAICLVAYQLLEDSLATAFRLWGPVSPVAIPETGVSVSCNGFVVSFLAGSLERVSYCRARRQRCLLRADLHIRKG